GNYARRKVDRLSGTRKGDGYIKSATSAHLERLIDILLHFEKWQNSLQEKNKELEGGEHAWKKHFITRESWFDLRLCILGFVSTCRFLFDRPAIFQVDSLSPNDRRFIGPRNLSQDLIEHRFSHYRGNNGTHRNPTAQEVKTRSQTGDVIRALNGKTRRNSNINANARVGQDFHVADTSGEIMMAVTREETSRRIRAASRNTHKSVLCPRSASRPPSYASFRKRRPDHNPEMDHPNPYKYGFWRDGPKRGKWGAPLFLHYVPLESAKTCPLKRPLDENVELFLFLVVLNNLLLMVRGAF
ncbi:unnamed protein product, partial [Pylaiella littoralis]